MSTGKNLTNVHVEGCVPTPLRRTLDQLKRNAEILLPLTSGESSPDLNINISNLYGGDDNEFVQYAAAAKLRVEGTLDGDLTRDGTATLSVRNPSNSYSDTGKNIQVFGRYVPTGKKVSSGARCAAFWNGSMWVAELVDGCVVTA